MKNRAIKSVIAAATSLALMGTGVAVAADETTNSGSSSTTASEAPGAQEDNAGSSKENLPPYEVNGKPAPMWLTIINALSVGVTVVASVLAGILGLVEGFKKLAK